MFNDVYELKISRHGSGYTVFFEGDELYFKTYEDALEFVEQQKEDN